MATYTQESSTRRNAIVEIPSPLDLVPLQHLIVTWLALEMLQRHAVVRID